MVSIAITEENSDPTADEVNCYGIDLPNMLLSADYTSVAEGGRGHPLPSCDNAFPIECTGKNGSCCRIHPKRFFFSLPGSN